MGVVNLLPYITSGENFTVNLQIKTIWSSIDCLYPAQTGNYPALLKPGLISNLRLNIHNKSVAFNPTHMIMLVIPGAAPTIVALELCIEHKYALIKQEYKHLIERLFKELFANPTNVPKQRLMIHGNQILCSNFYHVLPNSIIAPNVIQACPSAVKRDFTGTRSEPVNEPSFGTPYVYYYSPAKPCALLVPDLLRFAKYYNAAVSWIARQDKSSSPYQGLMKLAVKYNVHDAISEYLPSSTPSLYEIPQKIKFSQLQSLAGYDFRKTLDAVNQGLNLNKEVLMGLPYDTVYPVSLFTHFMLFINNENGGEFDQLFNLNHSKLKIKISPKTILNTFYNLCQKGNTGVQICYALRVLMSVYGYKDDLEVTPLMNKKDVNGDTALLRFLASVRLPSLFKDSSYTSSDEYIIQLLIGCGANCLIANKEGFYPFEFFDLSDRLSSSGLLLILENTVLQLKEAKGELSAVKIRKLLGVINSWLNKETLLKEQREKLDALVPQVEALLIPSIKNNRALTNSSDSFFYHHSKTQEVVDLPQHQHQLV